MTNSKKIQFLEINKEELKHAVKTIKTQLLSYEYCSELRMILQFVD